MNGYLDKPTYSVLVRRKGGDTDITELIESFDFEETVKKDNYLSLKIDSRFVDRYEGAGEVIQGDKLVFFFGWAAALGIKSAVHTAEVREVKITYRGDLVSITIRAFDKGNVIKKTVGTQVYKNKTTAEIVKVIAGRHGLTPIIEGGAAAHKSIPQGGKDDLTFLRYLADSEAGGDHVVYISGDYLHYVKRGTDKAAAGMFNLRNSEAGIISFDTSFDEKSKDASGAAATTAAGIDAKTGKAQTVTTTAANGKETAATLGNAKTTPSYAFNANADIIGRRVITTPATTVKPTAAAAATGQKQSNVLKGTLTVRLNPAIRANTVITVTGVMARDTGNWLVTAVKHTINTGAATTVIELEKNGQIKGAIPAKKKNTGAGKGTGQSKKIIFNENAYVKGSK